MDIKELRIGNSVLFGDKRVKVEGVVIQNGIVFFENDNAYVDMLDPIPLTPELVEELGFERGEDTNFPPYNVKGEYHDPQYKWFINECLANPEFAKEFSNQNFCFLWHLENEKKEEKWKITCEKGSMEITYLHELENMYHYMTGREL